MDKGGCIITYPVDEHVENALKAAIGLGANKIILMDENESYINSFNRSSVAGFNRFKYNMKFNKIDMLKQKLLLNTDFHFIQSAEYINSA